MGIHVALNHRTTYRYDRTVTLSPQVVRLRPAPHCRTPILSYSMTVTPETHFINWQQDPFSNYLGRLVFPEKTDVLVVGGGTAALRANPRRRHRARYPAPACTRSTRADRAGSGRLRFRIAGVRWDQSPGARSSTERGPASWKPSAARTWIADRCSRTFPDMGERRTGFRRRRRCITAIGS